MGARIGKIKIAANSNNILSEFFNTGEYDLRNKKLVKTISPAMDILISSNIERLIFHLFGDKRCKELFTSLKENNFFKLNKDELKLLQEDFEADFCTDLECKAYIKDFAKTCIIDPHTATCLKLVDNNKTQIISSTAEWTKFAPSMYEALFDKEVIDEQDALIDIAQYYEIGIKREILDLFNEKQKELKIYQKDAVKNAILEFVL